ncbi:MAG: efflux RND transporter periplasmic adaptor subunit [Acidobacteriota bacterium]
MSHQRTHQGRLRRILRRLVWPLLLMACVFVAYRVLDAEDFIALGWDTAWGLEQPPVPVSGFTPVDYRVTVRIRGELTGYDVVSVTVPPNPRGGLRIAWLAEEGAWVQPGEVVVRFDDTEARQQLEAGERELTKVGTRIRRTEEESELRDRELELEERRTRLEYEFAGRQVRKDETIFSRWEIEESVMNAALARFKQENVAARRRLQKQLSAADLAVLRVEQAMAAARKGVEEQVLNFLTVKAPAAGVVIHGRRGMEPVAVGDTVWPGQELLEVVALDRFKARGYIPEAEAAGVKVGQAVEIRLDAFPETTFSGRLRSLGPMAEQISMQDPRRYFQCEMILEAVPPEVMMKLRPGMGLTAEIVVGTYQDVFVLPQSAVFFEEGKALVFVREDEDFRRREVKVLARDHGFFIVEGLPPETQLALKHPFRRQELTLPDFSAGARAAQMRRAIIIR